MSSRLAHSYKKAKAYKRWQQESNTPLYILPPCLPHHTIIGCHDFLKLSRMLKSWAMASGGLMTYSQFKSSRQNSMNGSSSTRERGGGADHPNQEGEFEQVRSVAVSLFVLH